jgi:uncharacterized protein YggE
MKKLTLFLLPLSLVAFEVNFNKEFSKELMPDTLSTDLIVRIDSDNEKDISNRLAFFNEKIKLNKEVEKKLGNYTIRPNYKYSSNNTPKITGYIGELRYKINSVKAKSINQFISSVNELKESRDTSITVSGLSWKVKNSTYNVALDILRLEAINWAQTYAKNLSEDLHKKCTVKHVNINTYNRPRYARTEMAYDSMAKNASVPVPQANHQKISINPNYKLECK